MQKRAQHDGARRQTAMPYVTSEMAAIMQYVESELEDASLVKSLHFSPTALTLVRHVMMSAGVIITDTALTLAALDRQKATKLGVQLQCFIDDPQIVALAEQKRTTRAEVALDYALALPGLKMIVVGSAPRALFRLLQRTQSEALTDVVVLAAPTGFASVVQLKERIWDSNLPAIVVRGKKGGANAAIAIVNAILNEATREQNL